MAISTKANDADVLARLDSLARMGPRDAPSPWLPRVSAGSDLEANDPQAADLGKRGGRNRTRTCGLCRVKAVDGPDGSTQKGECAGQPWCPVAPCTRL